MTESSGNAQTRMYSAGVVKIKNQVHINLPVISYHHWISCSFMLFEQPQYRCVSTLWSYIVQVLWYKMLTSRQFHHKDSRVKRWINEIVTEIITNNMALFHGSWCITLKMHMSIQIVMQNTYPNQVWRFFVEQGTRMRVDFHSGYLVIMKEIIIKEIEFLMLINCNTGSSSLVGSEEIHEDGRVQVCRFCII